MRRGPIITALMVGLLTMAPACGRTGESSANSGIAVTTQDATTTAAQQWRRASLEVAGTTVSIACNGTGEPSVWFVSSLGEDGTEGWLGSGVPDKVAQRTRTCVYDRPGLGESGPPATDRTIENHTAELDQILSAAGETKPVVVVSQGSGTFVARLFAKQHLDRLAGLVLIDPVLWALPTNAPEGSDDGVRAEYAKVAALNEELGAYGAAALPTPPVPTIVVGVSARLPAKPPANDDAEETSGDVTSTDDIDGNSGTATSDTITDSSGRSGDGTGTGLSGGGSGDAGPAEPDLPQKARHEMQQVLANKSPFGKFVVLDEAGSAAQYWDPEAMAKVILEVLDHPNLRK
ncbi:MAG: alpha/beta hydrolase [Acidimicrobiales bacterium]|nr:alpha/beta hydrolase [Acidimicrobiales bacterium]